MALDYDKDYVVSLVKAIREADYLCDVTLVAGLDQRRFPVHRIVMAASSPYFKALLGPNYQEANQEEIVLNVLSGTTLNTIVNYCYSGTVRITNENVVEIMAAASSVDMERLEDKCAMFLSQQLDADCCINTYLIADQFNLIGLREKALLFVCKHFDKIPPADMMKLDVNTFNEILNSEKITAAEINIFDRFVQWVQHDESNRSKNVASIAKLIRLEHIPTGFLSGRVESFYEKYGCGHLVADEKNKREQKFKGKSERIFSHRYSPSSYCADFPEPGQVTVFKITGREFDVFKTISIEKPRNHFVFSNGNIYLFDDNTGANSRDMEMYDLITSKKEVLTDMPLNPMYGSPISIGKHIYIFGKHHQAHEDVPFTSCYRFDRERKLWEVRKTMPQRMGRLSVIELDGLIYVAGEIVETENYTSNFWCYDPNRDDWTEKAHTNLDKERIVLVKSHHSICICMTKVGFVKYDVAMNRWTKLDFEPRTLHIRKEPVEDYVLYDAIDYEDQSFGILSVDDGDLYVDFKMNSKYCDFNYHHLCCLELFLPISHEKKHLFVH